jgi:5-methylcytosine-specific restriction endonuclease McrA
MCVHPPRDSGQSRVASTREWRRRYPDKARALYRLHRHRRRTAEGSFTITEWDVLCERYGNRCLACGRVDLPLTIDHVIPLSKGGTNWITDVQPLCKSCNSAKGDRIIDYR